jgi:hypothetical protein
VKFGESKLHELLLFWRGGALYLEWLGHQLAARLAPWACRLVVLACSPPLPGAPGLLLAEVPDWGCLAAGAGPPSESRHCYLELHCLLMTILCSDERIWCGLSCQHDRYTMRFCWWIQYICSLWHWPATRLAKYLSGRFSVIHVSLFFLFSRRKVILDPFV